MDNILEMKNVTKVYDDFVLDDINLTIERGYTMGFIGPNGSGKSTTINCIMNLIKADGGSIKVNGLDHVQQADQVKEKIGFVYDDMHYYEHLTIHEMRNLMRGFYMQWDDAAFNKYLKAFSLKPEKKIMTLSKGMKTKFSIAVALSHNAELLIMDEPTSGLDPVFRNELMDILIDVMQPGDKSLFFSTHITTDLDYLGDYITFINDGEIVFSESREEVNDRYKIIKGSPSLLDDEMKKSFIGMRISNVGFEGLVKQCDPIMEQLASQAIIERPTLDQIMIYSVKGETNV